MSEEKGLNGAAVLYVDGGCSGNGQRDIAKRHMISVVTTEEGIVLSERRAPRGSNNIAELMAVRDALRWCREHAIADVEIYTDSRNNFAWVFNRKVGLGINDRAVVMSLRNEITVLRQAIGLRLTWVPREDNKAGHYIESTHGL